MPSIKELSDYIWKDLPGEKRVNIKGQAARLEAVEPWFTYERLRNIRSGTTRHKERPEEVRVFKQVFAKELEGYGGAGKENDPDKQLASFEQDIEELKELLKTANTDREDIQEQLRKLASVIETQIDTIAIICN